MSETPENDVNEEINDCLDEDDEENESMEQTTHLTVFLEEGFYDR